MKVNAAARQASVATTISPTSAAASGRSTPVPCPADQLGDLAALAASMPGVQLIPGADGNPAGFSVLGLGADQNATTLNGMNFGGAAMPRDANVSTSLVTSPYDVSRGNFSGGQLNIRSRPRARTTSFARRASTSTRRSCSGPTARRGRSASSTRTSRSAALVAGPISTDKAFFNAVVSARPPAERSSEFAQHRRARPADGRHRRRIRSAGCCASSAESHVPTDGRRRPERPLRRIRRSCSARSTSRRRRRRPGRRSTSRSTAAGTGQTRGAVVDDGAAGAQRRSHELERRRPGRATTSYFGFGILSETSLGVSRQQQLRHPVSRPAERQRCA